MNERRKWSNVTDLEDLGLSRSDIRTLNSIKPTLREVERIDAEIERSGISRVDVDIRRAEADIGANVGRIAQDMRDA